MTELGSELLLGAQDLALALEDVDRDADRARLVGDAALNRLADPPGRVGRKLVAAPVVKLLGGADQPEHPFLDQVEERDAVSLVVLRDRDDESQVRAHHAVLRVLVAALDPLRQFDLLGRGQQTMPRDLVQELAERLRL